MPPRRGESGTCGPGAVAPHGRSNPGCVGERAVVSEVDTGAAPSPSTQPRAPSDSVVAHPDPTSLGEGDYAVIPPQEILEHCITTVSIIQTAPLSAICGQFRGLSARNCPQIARSGRAGPLRRAARALPDPVSRPGRSCATRPRGRRAPPAASSAAGWQGPASPAAARPPAFAPA